MDKELALESKGATITFSTSSHPQFQPEFMIDGDDKTFFMTTGSFPQTFTLQLATVSPVFNIALISTGSLSLLFSLSYNSSSSV